MHISGSVESSSALSKAEEGHTRKHTHTSWDDAIEMHIFANCCTNTHSSLQNGGAVSIAAFVRVCADFPPSLSSGSGVVRNAGREMQPYNPGLGRRRREYKNRSRPGTRGAPFSLDALNAPLLFEDQGHYSMHTLHTHIQIRCCIIVGVRTRSTNCE